MSPGVPILGVVEPAGRIGQLGVTFGYSASVGTAGSIPGAPCKRSVVSADLRRIGELNRRSRCRVVIK
jgi:hypothetical protein